MIYCSWNYALGPNCEIWKFRLQKKLLSALIESVMKKEKFRALQF